MNLGLMQPRKRGLELATDTIEHMQRWCITEANAVAAVLGYGSPVVNGLQAKAWHLRNTLEFLAEDAKADA